MDDAERREWLLRRVDEAYANAEPMIRDQCFGRVLGLLEVGTAFGYWSKKTADGFSETIRCRYRYRRGFDACGVDEATIRADGRGSTADA